MKPFDSTTPNLSQVYDSHILNTIPYYESIHKEIIHVVRTVDHDPSVWLDTGAGTGTLVEKCLPIFPDTRFVLADPSEEMLSVAQRKFDDSDRNRIQILPPASTEELKGLSEIQPDVITATQCHHYLSREERSEATKVCFDLLRPGGVFVTFENTRPFTETGIANGKKRWGDFQRSRGKQAEQISKHLDRFDTEYFPITVEEHLKLYRDCGFQVVELLWFSYMQAGFYCIK